jgi:hypothetical protein
VVAPSVITTSAPSWPPAPSTNTCCRRPPFAIGRICLSGTKHNRVGALSVGFLGAANASAVFGAAAGSIFARNLLKRLDGHVHLDAGLHPGSVQCVPNRLQRNEISHLAVKREAQQSLHQRIGGLLQSALSLGASLPASVRNRTSS